MEGLAEGLNVAKGPTSFDIAHSLVTTAWVPLLGFLVFGIPAIAILLVFAIVYLLAPTPRRPYPAEKTYTFVSEEGATRKHHQLPCWYDQYVAEKEADPGFGKAHPPVYIQPPDLFISLVVPAYNEEERLGVMLTEAVTYLEQNYGEKSKLVPVNEKGAKGGNKGKGKKGGGSAPSRNLDAEELETPTGYEIIVVSDGSTDRTIETALAFARQHVPAESRPNFRVVSLEKNRGKGGAVTHGLRHVRGAYALFADADGATRFSDLSAVLDAARVLELKRASAILARRRQKQNDKKSDEKVVEDPSDPPPPPPGAMPAVSVGSRAHMVNTPAVVKRSALRNLLMRGFHVFLKLMTPRRTARIGDTQCGFKLFSRGALPAIVPWMHSEGWIFDVEMLMLAESAGIEVAEVPVGWKEIKGSKLNVLWDSLGMAWGLAILRGAWVLGVYRRKW